MKKKLGLKSLRVQSFVTNAMLTEYLKGGSDTYTASTNWLIDCRPCDSDGCGGGTGGDSDGIVGTEIGFQ